MISFESTKKIDRDLEETTFSSSQQSNLINRFQVPLGLAIFLLLIEYLIVRRGTVFFMVPILFSNYCFSSWFSNEFTNRFQDGEFKESEKVVQDKKQ